MAAGIFLVEFQQAGQVKPEHLTVWCQNDAADEKIPGLRL